MNKSIIILEDQLYYKMFRVHPKKGEPGHDEPIDRKGTFSEELLDNFGMPMDEYLRQTAVIETDGYVSMAALTGPAKPEGGMSENNTPEQLTFNVSAEQTLESQKPNYGVPFYTDQPSGRGDGMNV